MSDAADEVWVVEDDAKIAALLVDYLRHAGFVADSIADGALALERLRARQPSLLILDLMLPGLDGLALCRALRRFCAVPVIMLTARVDEVDRLLGLDTGADDYVCKPFSPPEVIARVRAQLRRARAQVVQGDAAWRINDETLCIAWGTQPLPLTPLEFRLLRTLLLQPGRVFSRQQLLDALHADLRDVSDRAVDSHIKNLRRKIEAAAPDAERIASVYGVGYRIESTR
ncbi:transcriptional regulator [beta proteobacterium AAP121]|nr:transcriptional regulator [beta proteobacterium AAP65]KPF95165.1 transcriptional regulator [beta proteobacterium AAP121]